MNRLSPRARRVTMLVGIGFAAAAVLALIVAAFVGAHPFGWSLATFVPDLVVGVVTGLIVALALRTAEQRREERARRAAADEGWRSVLPAVISTMREQPLEPWAYDRLGPGEIAQVFRSFQTLTGAHDFRGWQRALPDEPLLALVVQLMDDIVDLDEKAQIFDARLEEIFINHSDRVEIVQGGNFRMQLDWKVAEDSNWKYVGEKAYRWVDAVERIERDWREALRRFQITMTHES